MTNNKSTVKIEQPLYTMNINQDPYHGTGGFDGGGEPGAVPEIDIRSITGVNLEQLDMPHMLEVLRGLYDREGSGYRYRPRAFHAQNQTGTITDIQASLFFRFQSAGEQIQRLLRELKPMIPDPDIEDCEAARELVLDGVNELVEEARWQGGPRKLKLEGAFRKLDSYLALLKNRFGLAESRARIASEADNWAKFVTIVDIFTDMKNSWEIRKDDLDRTGDESYGNQVVWLNRLLGTVKEAAARLRFQLKALLVGEAEMATKFIGSDQMTTAELLDWTAEVCDRGLMVSLRAGKDGMYALSFDLENLENVYTSLISDIDHGCSVPINELCEEHIYQTLGDIVIALQDAATRARLAIPAMDMKNQYSQTDRQRTAGRREHETQQPATTWAAAASPPASPPVHPTFEPVILGVTPTFAEAGTTIDIDLIGQHFDLEMLNSSWELFPNHIYQVIDCNHISDTRMRLRVNITSDPRWAGTQSLAVLMDGKFMWSDENAFYVIPGKGEQHRILRDPFTLFDVADLASDERAVSFDALEIPLDVSANAKRLMIQPTMIYSSTASQEPAQKPPGPGSYEEDIPPENKSSVQKSSDYAAEKTSPGIPRTASYPDFLPVTEQDLTGESDMPREPVEEWEASYETLEAETTLSEAQTTDIQPASQEVEQQIKQAEQSSTSTAVQDDISQPPASEMTQAETKKKRGSKKATGAS